MSRRLAVLGIVLMLTGCAGASTPSERPSQAGATGVAPAMVASPSPPAIATELPAPEGVVAYSVRPGDYSCPTWVVGDDGTGAHELLPDERSEQGPSP